MIAKFLHFLRQVLANLLTIPTRLFGSRNERLLKQYGRTVDRINALEASIGRLSDAELRAKTDEFRTRLADRIAAAPEADRAAAEREGLEELLPEAFAVVREAGKRTLRMRHFDEQLLGGIVLHYGKIAEMRTGEGKTLVATLPTYLNSLTGKGVHIVTVNDYLARRDAEWMGKVYNALGMTVGVIQHDAAFIYDPTYRGEEASMTALRPATHRREAYAADITYGT